MYKNKYVKPEYTTLIYDTDSIMCSTENGDASNGNENDNGGGNWSPVVPFD